MRRPEVLLPVTFLAAILLGTGLLLLPGMSRGDHVGVLEALFTSTSAVCVTGLVVVDTGTVFTTAGQVVIAGLIQVGGLGIMTLSVLLLVIAGRRVGLDQEASMKETFTTVASWRVGRLLGAVVVVTLVFELAGFGALYAATGDAWYSAFHAVSAFCNAGFSLSSASLRGQGPAVVLPILFLFVMGGLGFTTLLEIARNLRPRRDGRRRFSVHARIVFTTSIVLWGGGTILLALCEKGDLESAFFMSASARTAGFDTIDVGSMSGASLFVLIPLMLVGASPGSTGGGIKTTTLALAVLVARATLRGQERLVAYRRELPHRLVARMFAVIFFSVSVVFLAIFLLHLFEGDRGGNVLHYAFEATSAFGTVGLSTGLTAGLTAASKLLLCVVMFLGRVGTLSIFVLIVRKAPPSRVRYPEESVLIG